MGNKLTYDFIFNEFGLVGYTLVSKEYKNARGQLPLNKFSGLSSDTQRKS